MAKFEGQERRMPGINACLKEYGMNTLEDARDLTLEHGINVEEIVKGVQPIAFENASWAYTLGCAVAIKKNVQTASDAAAAIGRAGTIGSVEPGKQADLLLWNAPDLDYVCYRFGSNLVGTVMKKGRIVHEE